MSVVRPDFVKKRDLSAHGKDKIQKRTIEWGKEKKFPTADFQKLKETVGKRGVKLSACFWKEDGDTATKFSTPRVFHFCLVRIKHNEEKNIWLSPQCLPASAV